MSQDRYFVYIPRSKKYPERLHIGLTENVPERIKDRNAESSKYSKAYAPWELETYISVKDKESAWDLERYWTNGKAAALACVH